MNQSSWVSLRRQRWCLAIGFLKKMNSKSTDESKQNLVWNNFLVLETPPVLGINPLIAGLWRVVEVIKIIRGRT